MRKDGLHRPRVRRRDPEAMMSLIAPLTVLRNRIAKSLLAPLVVGGFAFWHGH